jgi:hypothetical protein
MRTTARILTASLVAAVAFFVTVESASAGPPPYHNDGRIKVPGGPVMGNDVYNNDGTGQTVEQQGGDGDKLEYRIQGQNDGALRDRMGFSAATNDEPNFKVKFKKGTTNITSQVLGSGYKSKLLDSGQKATIRLIVKILEGANGVHEVTVEVDSIRDGPIPPTDTVIARTVPQ